MIGMVLYVGLGNKVVGRHYLAYLTTVSLTSRYLEAEDTSWRRKLGGYIKCLCYQCCDADRCSPRVTATKDSQEKGNEYLTRNISAVSRLVLLLLMAHQPSEAGRRPSKSQTGVRTKLVPGFEEVSTLSWSLSGLVYGELTEGGRCCCRYCIC